MFSLCHAIWDSQVAALIDSSNRLVVEFDSASRRATGDHEGEHYRLNWQGLQGQILFCLFAGKYRDRSGFPLVSFSRKFIRVGTWRFGHYPAVLPAWNLPPRYQ